MDARVVLGVGKVVLFRDVSSVQECPYKWVPIMCYRNRVYIKLY